MKKLKAVLFVVLVLFIIIGSHEFAHGFVGSLFGVEVKDVEIGFPLPPTVTFYPSFGPSITISPWLIAAGVDMTDPQQLPVIPAIFILLAGPLMNVFLFGLAMYLSGLLAYDIPQGQKLDGATGIVGPIGVFKDMYRQYQRFGMRAFFRVLGVMSLGMGILNLIPIPPLDGGRILERIILALSGDNPAVSRGLDALTIVGALFFLLMMFFISGRDVGRR